MKSLQHPVDFSPYLDRDYADKRYEEIRRHLDSCIECRDEVKALRALDGMFRAPELEMPLPEWHWQRIQARLETSRPRPGWLERMGILPAQRQIAWGMALSLLALAVVTVSTWQFRQQARENRLMELVQYTEAEHHRLKTADNPFRMYAIGSGNPFAKAQSTIAGGRDPSSAIR
jgi:anti-sigma factor RsiW